MTQERQRRVMKLLAGEFPCSVSGEQVFGDQIKSDALGVRAMVNGVLSPRLERGQKCYLHDLAECVVQPSG